MNAKWSLSGVPARTAREGLRLKNRRRQDPVQPDGNLETWDSQEPPTVSVAAGGLSSLLFFFFFFNNLKTKQKFRKRMYEGTSLKVDKLLKNIDN